MSDTPKDVTLRFDTNVVPPDQLKDVLENLSAVVQHGDHLWLGGDEGTCIDRMTRQPSGEFGAHARFDLKPLLNLPGPADQEIDVEGLDVNGGYLWLIGSHSAKRKKAEDKKTPEENFERLGKIEAEGNRFTLGRVPLDAGANPVPAHGTLTAARLEGNAKGNLLTAALRTDKHIGRFVPEIQEKGVLGIPSKDNGFDVEGLAVSGNRVFLGLRGPVLRGCATVIELRVSDGPTGTLKLEPLGPEGKPYLKHFLQLDGLGVRDLVIQGDDLLILAGPSMDLDGPVFIYRWKGPLSIAAQSFTPRKALDMIVTVPFKVKKDHAEGLTRAKESPLTLMVCYDSPHDERLVGKDGVKADLFVPK